MCGDIEEDGPSARDEQLYGRFLLHARSLLAQHERTTSQTTGELYQYMDKLFADALSRCVRDGEQAEEGKRYEYLAAQPLVFARLAGFLAAHLSLTEDPLRRIVEAMMMGYAEADEIEPDHGHDHGHDHHHHGHDHHH
jgi:hypothetical protein